MSGDTESTEWLEGWWDGTSSASRSIVRVEGRSGPYREGFRQGLASGATGEETPELKVQPARTLTRRAFAVAALSGAAAVLLWAGTGRTTEASPSQRPPTWQNVSLPFPTAMMDRLDSDFQQHFSQFGLAATRAHILARFDAVGDGEKGFVVNWVMERGLSQCPDLLIDFVEHAISVGDEHLTCETAAAALFEASMSPQAVFPVGSKSRVLQLIPSAPSPRLANLLAAIHANLPV